MLLSQFLPRPAQLLLFFFFHLNETFYFLFDLISICETSVTSVKVALLHSPLLSAWLPLSCGSASEAICPKAN